jgi:hypothetical protein
LDQPIAVELRDKTVRQALDEILHQGRDHNWRLRNGIIEIRNKQGSKRADKQLNSVVPVFTIPASYSVKMASAMLWMNLQAKLDPRGAATQEQRAEWLGKISEALPGL